MTSTEQQIEQFIGILISLGGSAGNQRLLEALGWQDSIYQRIKQQLIDNGRIRPGRGRGGSVALVENVASLPKPGTKPSAAIKRQANEARKEDKHDATRDKDMRPIEQQFFNDLEKKLWTAADKLRSNLDAAVYKHVVLGLIFLKYVSDAFEERQRELREQFTNPDHDYYMDPDEYGGAGTQEYEDNIATELEVRDYYTEKNVFWVPVEARWQTLRDCAQLPPGEALPWNAPGKDVPEKMRSVGWLIDNAMEAVERENAR
ncbi:type I restriction-modification system subunit M N-terminal domain-containing protein, partial [Pseudomonas aeruginosa]